MTSPQIDWGIARRISTYLLSHIAKQLTLFNNNGTTIPLMEEIRLTTWENNGINYQPQLVSRISAINSMTAVWSSFGQCGFQAACVDLLAVMHWMRTNQEPISIMWCLDEESIPLIEINQESSKTMSYLQACWRNSSCKSCLSSIISPRPGSCQLVVADVFVCHLTSFGSLLDSAHLLSLSETSLEWLDWSLLIAIIIGETCSFSSHVRIPTVRPNPEMDRNGLFL